MVTLRSVKFIQVYTAPNKQILQVWQLTDYIYTLSIRILAKLVHKNHAKKNAKFLIISLWPMEEAPEDVTGGMPITTASKLR